MIAVELNRTQSRLWKLTGSSIHKPSSDFDYGYRANETINLGVGTLSVADPEHAVLGFILGVDGTII